MSAIKAVTLGTARTAAMAIEPGEPADLILDTWQMVYRKLGRDKIIELIKNGTSLEDAKALAGIGKKRKAK